MMRWTKKKMVMIKDREDGSSHGGDGPEIREPGPKGQTSQKSSEPQMTS